MNWPDLTFPPINLWTVPYMNRRTKKDNFVVLMVSEELLKHYLCKGCSKWFTIGDSTVDPTSCPNCNKHVRHILYD